MATLVPRWKFNFHVADTSGESLRKVLPSLLLDMFKPNSKSMKKPEDFSMAGSKFQYDESGGTFFYFLLSFLALVLIPNRLTLNEPLKKWKVRLTKGLIVFGWIAFLATAYKVSHLERDYVDWNPYDILQVDQGATQAEIKRAYRKLSLLYHPDKDTGDAKKFLQLTKAHAALTDEDARRNWEMYGNPDGPGATSFGIALPSWIVEKENSFWVLGLYALVFMVALPVIVGLWWRRSIKFGGDKVLLETTKLYYYFINKTPRMALKRVLTIIAGSFEFDKSHNSEIIERPTDNIELPLLIKQYTNFGKSKEPCISYPYSVKARAILFAHLSRIELSVNTLEQDRLYIVKKCPYLINELVQCVARLTQLFLSGHTPSMPPLETIESCMKLCPMIVQALWEKKHSFLQLPHIYEGTLKHFHRKSRSVNRLRDFVKYSYEDRRDMLRILSQEQFDDVMNVCAQMPFVELEVKTEVLGDNMSTVISCGATVTVTVKMTRKPLLSEDAKQQIRDDDDYDKGNSEEETEEQSESKAADKVTPASVSTAAKKKPVWQKQKKKGKVTKSKKKVKQQVMVKKGSQTETKPEASKESKETVKSKTRTDKEDSESCDEDKDDTSSKASEDGKDSEVSDDDDESWRRLQAKLSNKEKVAESKSRVSHTVHCPFFSEEKQEYWWLYIVDLKHCLILTSPCYVTDLVDEKEMTLQVIAPEKVGVYHYTVYLRSDSYIDGDFRNSFKLDVKAAEKEEEPEYGISDEEKDESEKEDSTGLMTDEDDTSEDSEDDDDNRSK
ncbi:secretory subunit [Chamberlinius hualienensis]